MTKKQNLPKHIDILGTRVKLLVDSELKDAFGEWDLANCQITLAEENDSDYCRVTLMHEILHALDDFTGLGLSHKNVYIISQGIFSIIKANPEIVSWLIDESP